MSSIKNAHKYPYMTDLINNGGGLSLESIVDMKMTAFAFDEGGAIWQGKSSYDSIEALLDDAEAGMRGIAGNDDAGLFPFDCVSISQYE
jgi:hypothetical protein